MKTETIINAIKRARSALHAGDVQEAVGHLDAAALGLCGPNTPAVCLTGALAALALAGATRSSARHARKLDEAITLLGHAVKRARREVGCDASSPSSSS